MDNKAADILRELKTFASNMPELPGSYQYYDADGEIIYVGKAKNLKRRVSSYFNKDQKSSKTRMLVSKIRRITYSVVHSEADALLLENNLIKKYKPKYNVLLKDDKTYPSICITKEDYPRIFKTRNREMRGATYYGPYSHVHAMDMILDFINKTYAPRPCRMAMTKEKVLNGDYNICLNYQIGKCKAPCIGKQSQEDYMDNISACKEILKGNTIELMRSIKSKMIESAERLDFEKAQALKEQLDLLNNFQARSEVVNPSNNNIDAFSIDVNENLAYVNYLHVVKGSIVQAFTIELKKRLDESKEELLALAIVELRQRFQSASKEIIVPFAIDLPLEGVTCIVPQRGDKLKLLKLSELNVREYRLESLKQQDKLNPEQKAVRLMKDIQNHLHLPTLPYRIELFDNSNTQGSNPVAGCVVFEKLKPAKKEYRTYEIKSVIGPNDYASMQEVVRRRYKRLIEEGKKLPDLIITDGGKGQMECVRKVVEDELGLKIPIAGLSKDSRHRTNELLYGSPAVVVGMSQSSELFRLLTRMQDEVHRFAIAFHRKKRMKSQTHSALDDIKGVGEATKSLLIKEFKSYKRLVEAPQERLEEVLGKKRGSKLFLALHPFIESKNEEE